METSDKFVRENRYIVIRYDDIYKYLSDEHRWWLNGLLLEIEEGRRTDGKDPCPTFVCIKDTYPEYEMVWAAIEKRMTSSPQGSDG